MEKKIMKAIALLGIRGLVEEVNALGIEKEDIVSLIQDKGQYFLLYYGEE